MDCFGRIIKASPPPYNSNCATKGFLLLYQINQMPKAKPISMQDALMIASLEDERLYRTAEDSPEHKTFWDRWVLWVSYRGFHIELTGDEFEILQAESSFG